MIEANNSFKQKEVSSKTDFFSLGVSTLDVHVNNDVLARFLGWFTDDKQPKVWYKIVDDKKCIAYQQYQDIYKELLFHKDWNYLNEIVDKIEKLGYTTSLIGGKNGFYFSIQFRNICLFNHNDSTNKREAVYKGCAYFCKLYKIMEIESGKK